jgi:hypothetical protein
VRGNGIAYAASKSQHGGICQACENSGRPVLSTQDAKGHGGQLHGQNRQMAEGNPVKAPIDQKAFSGIL